MLPPVNASVSELSAKEGICAATLYFWRKQALKNNHMNNDKTNADNWSSSKQFQAVPAYCRQHVIYPQQLAGWKAQCITTHFTAEKASQAQQKKEKSYQKQVMQLEKELRRNEKALAEADALMVLQKKFNVMLG